jgi:peptidoglycan/xylan/chitin deacetylase (PgdA/CDA1 family)
MIMWSIDTLDWKTKDAQNTINTVLNNIKDGDIVLMHELYTQTGDAAVQIIPALIERGYQLVTVSELARYRGGLEKGKLYSAFRP